MLIGPHCADWPLKSEEKPRTIATLTLGLILHALQLRLLPALRLDITLDLVRLGAVAATAFDGRQLPDQPLADGVCGSGLARRRRGRKTLLRHSAMAQQRRAHKRSGGKSPSQERRIRQAVTILADRGAADGLTY